MVVKDLKTDKLAEEIQSLKSAARVNDDKLNVIKIELENLKETKDRIIIIFQGKLV